MIPDLDPQTGRLPWRGNADASIYPTTLEEFLDRFATATTAERVHRGARFRCWFEDLQASGMPGRLLISGSFLTAKPVPSDVDALVLFEPEDADAARKALGVSHALWTWQDVRAEEPRHIRLARLQPYGGFVDAHYGLNAPVVGPRWKTDWTTEFDENDTPTGVRMGCLEVKR